MITGQQLLRLRKRIDEELADVLNSIQTVEKQVGPQGLQGERGEKGDPGVDGRIGADGADGADGSDGVDGRGIADIRIAFDDHLVITLTDGTEIDAGELPSRDGTGDHFHISQGGGARDLDMDSYAATAQFVASETITAGDVCYVDGSGTMSIADNAAPSTSDSMLGVAVGDVAAAGTGTFLLKGMFNDEGTFTTGSPLYLANAGAVSDSPPSAAGSVIRVLGYSVSTSRVFFDPDKTWMEIAP